MGNSKEKIAKFPWKHREIYDYNTKIAKIDARKWCYRKKCIKSNPRYFYSYAKRFSKTKSTVSPLRNADGDLTNDPQQKADLLQDQYVKVFSDPAQADVDECLKHVKPDLGDTTELSDITINEENIIKAIQELDPYSSTPDGDIPALILINCNDHLAVPLKMMWAESFGNGTIPPSLKSQYITPVYRKGIAQTQQTTALYQSPPISSKYLRRCSETTWHHTLKKMGW